MSGEDFAQHVDTVRQRPTVLSPHAKQASQKHLTLDFHELPTAIDELRAAGQSGGELPFQIPGSVLGTSATSSI